MIYLLVFVVALVVGLLFNYGAHKKPTPKPGDE